MTGENEIYVKVTKDGPYEVYGKPTIRKAAIEPNAEGESWDYKTGEELDPWSINGGHIQDSN